MAITQGSNANASDFINESGRNAVPANDAGRVPKLESDGRLDNAFLPNLLPFGTGADGDATLDGVADYVAFSSRSGSEYTLTRDVNLGTLTINSGVTLITNGYLIFADTITGAGTVKWGAPNPGVGASSAAGAAGGSAGGAGRLKNAAGGAGGAGNDENANGVSGTSTGALSNSIGAQGGAGGAGSDDSAGIPGSGGSSGTVTQNALPTKSDPVSVLLCLDLSLASFAASEFWQGGSGGGGGGGGTTSDTTLGGGGGGGGASGGIVFIAARLWAGTFTINAAGAAGGAGYAASSGQGGGGGGGGGGSAIVIYRSKTWTGTSQLSGGTGGAAGGGTAVAGSNGSNGTLYQIPI